MQRCDRVVRAAVGWSVLDLISSDDDAWLHHVDRVQISLFTVMVSLAGLWGAVGVHPDVVVGHSQRRDRSRRCGWRDPPWMRVCGSSKNVASPSAN